MSHFPSTPSSSAIHCTHPKLRIRNTQDAMVVFEAVRRGILPLVERRLTAAEREALSSGNVFVWEEGEHKQGLERWTDGRRWSQSRLRNEFLYYDEKQPVTQEERDIKAARRAEYASGSTSIKPIFRRSDRPTKPEGLTKQTFSILVRRNPMVDAYKKWHIVAYISPPEQHYLPFPEQLHNLRLNIPPGIFQSSRVATAPRAAESVTGGTDMTTSDDEMSPRSPRSSRPPTRSNSNLIHQYPSLRSPADSNSSRDTTTGRLRERTSLQQVMGTRIDTPSTMTLRHPGIPNVTYPYPPVVAGRSRPAETPVERPPSAPIRSGAQGDGFHFSFANTHAQTHLSNTTTGSSSGVTRHSGRPYQPLSPEDTRALNAFELKL